TTLMKSRRRIAFPKAGTTPIGARLQQGFATSEMGFRGQFAQQQSQAAHVRFGSKADIAAPPWRKRRNKNAISGIISFFASVFHFGATSLRKRSQILWPPESAPFPAAISSPRLG